MKFIDIRKTFYMRDLFFLFFLLYGLCISSITYAKDVNDNVVPNLIEVQIGVETKNGTPLTLSALQPLTLTLKELGWNPENTALIPVRTKLTKRMIAGEIFAFTYVAPFDYPSMEICAKADTASNGEFCWRPDFESDEGNSKVFGFIIKE